MSWGENTSALIRGSSHQSLFNAESQRSKHSFFLSFPFFLRLSVSCSSTWGLEERAWQDSHCFLGQVFLHGRPSRPPTYLVATPGIWCFERPRSSADSDRQGLCVLSVWKRQTGPGICFQLLSLRTHRLAHGDVASHTDTAGSRRGRRKKKKARLKDQFVNTLGRHCPAITSWIWSSQCDLSDTAELVELIHATQDLNVKGTAQPSG